MTTSPRTARRRVARSATVVRTERLTTDLVRIIARVDDPSTMPELPFTDHYVKLLFAPQGAGYSWPFDPEKVQEERPRQEWPVTRTYTVRTYDPATGELALDFVVHGDTGLAGPWAERVQPGERFGFFGPGGAWAPEPSADVHLLVGDESATPAVFAALEALPAGARAEVFLETRDASTELPVPTGPDATVTWVHRDAGQELARTVRAAAWPAGRVEAFVHGNADTVRDLRRYLFVERGLDRRQASISGYWRPGQNEDIWQATKQEFVKGLEVEEAAAGAR